MTKVESLQKEYDHLSERCGSFDQETIKMRREIEEHIKKWGMDRKRERQDLIAQKGRVFEQMQAAKAVAVAEDVAADALELQPDNAAPAGGTVSAPTPEPAVETAPANTQPAETNPPVVETTEPSGETKPPTDETNQADVKSEPVDAEPAKSEPEKPAEKSEPVKPQHKGGKKR